MCSGMGLGLHVKALGIVSLSRTAASSVGTAMGSVFYPQCPDCGVYVIQQSESEDQKVLQASHSSHGIIMSQFWTGIGGTSK